jgi:uncharacterized protein (TIRG00374 family)
MTLVRTARVVLPTLLAVVLLLVVLPRTSGGHWTTIGTALRAVSPVVMAGLAVVWLIGLVAHMLVLTAALPGLTVRRGLLMSLTGSAVSNVLPLGGAAGTALNYSMARRWGHSRSAFVAFTVISHVWGILAKLAMPLIALGAVLVTGRSAGLLLIPAVIAAVALVGLGVTAWTVVARESAALTIARGLEQLIARVARRKVDLAAPTRALRVQVIAMTRRDWRRPAGGMLAYFTLQAVLLWLCLITVGAVIGPVQMFAVYAVERLLSVVVLTPGGLGVVEVTTTAMVAAAGVAPTLAAAGVVLYRAFTYALEIPVGAALLLGWIALRRRALPVAAPA